MKNEMQTRGNGLGRGSSPNRLLWDEFDRFFESFLTPSARGFEGPATFTPPYDLEETENAYLMTFDVPGVAQSDLKIEVNDNQLRVSGERRREDRESTEGFRRYERAYGKFERVFTLPRNVDTNGIEAQHDAGVLRLVLPKAEHARPRTIRIGSTAESGGEGLFSKWFNKTKLAGSAGPQQ